MSVTVRHLNADCSFLLTFSPEVSPSTTDNAPHQTYSVLIDPWLHGPSIVNYSWFAITKHNVPSSISHLSEIEEPDLVIVSQNKPDHCHKDTLHQLRPEGKTMVAAEPGAAKAIKSWNHFDPARVFGLPKYNPHKRFSLLRFHIPPLAPGGDAGEVTVAFMPAKNYMTGLHNAIGITYQAPTAFKTLARVCTFDLPKTGPVYENPFSPVTLPPSSPRMPLSPMQARPNTSDGAYEQPQATMHYAARVSDDTSEYDLPFRQHSELDANLLSPFSPISKTYSGSSASSTMSPPTPPETPENSPLNIASGSPTISFTHTPASSFSSPHKPPPLKLVKAHPARPRPLSVLFTPHGVPMNDVIPYVQHHLIPQSALPLTLLFHSFSRATNPWYLGGNIMAGSTNGVEIARALMARVWLSAHDEDKDDQGFSVKKLKVQCSDAESVRKLLYKDENERVETSRLPGLGSPKKEKRGGETWRKNGWICDVRDLGVGKSMLISAGERDLVDTAPKSFFSVAENSAVNSPTRVDGS